MTCPGLVGLGSPLVLLPALRAGGTWDGLSRGMEQEQGSVMEENRGRKMHWEFSCRFARMKIPSSAVSQMLMLTP